MNCNLFEFQTEACEAGLEPQVLQEWIKEIDGHEEDALADILHKEIQKWSQNCVDVEALQRRVARSEETCRILSKKVTILQSQLQKLQLEKMNNYNNQDRQKATEKNQNQKLSSNAEDEGISSSERSSSPEDLKHRQNSGKIGTIQDNDQETTIDDVIEELRIIVKDAEEEFEDRNQNSDIREKEIKTKVSRSNSKRSSNKTEIETYDKKSNEKENRRQINQITRTNIENVNNVNNLSQNLKKNQITYFGSESGNISRRASSQDSGRISKSSTEGGVKIVVKGPDVEEAIVPAILHPQPPRRTPPCLSVMLAVRNCDLVDNEVYNSHDEEIEEETLGDGSDSLLSASRLKYNDGKENSNHFPLDARVNIDQMKVPENFESLKEFVSDGRRGGKILRNASSMESKAASDQPGSFGNLESFKQFESVAKQNGLGQKQSHRHRSEVEKKKFLRRSTSHDFLESNNSSPHSRRSGSRIEGKIRKFESLNSFDERQSLQNFSRFMDVNSRYILFF